MRWSRIGLGAVALGLMLTGAAKAQCQATPFACEVDASIERGLQFIRALERGEGRYGLRGIEANFLAVLNFLERPDGVGWQGQPQGYNGLDQVDQAMIVRLVQGILNSEPALTNPNLDPTVYVVGGDLMALSAYLASGGPNDVGTAITVRQAIANGVVALQNNQGHELDNNGGWNYRQPEQSGDLSATQFAASGLHAASGELDAMAILARLPNFLMAAQNDDGGLGYHPGDLSTSHDRRWPVVLSLERGARW